MISIPPWFRKGHRAVTKAVSIACVVLCIIILALDVLLPEHLRSAFASRVPMITLLLLGLYILTSLEHENRSPGPERTASLGIKNIFRDREDEGQIAGYLNLLESARQELFIVGVTLKDLSGSQFGRLVERASAGCKIDLLMLSPKFKDNKDPILDPVALGTLTSNFRIAIARIRSLAKKIHANGRGKLAVRFYSTAPTVSLTVRDGSTSRGRMHVEVVPHQTSADTFRPIIDIAKEGEREIFSEFYGRYKALWDASKSKWYLEVDPSRWSDIQVNAQLDLQVSAWLSLDADWKAAEDGSAEE